MGLSCDVKMMYRWASEFNACDDGSKVSDGNSIKGFDARLSRTRLEKCGFVYFK